LKKQLNKAFEYENGMKAINNKKAYFNWQKHNFIESTLLSAYYRIESNINDSTKLFLLAEDLNTVLGTTFP
jgi:hypothetical protein